MTPRRPAAASHPACSAIVARSAALAAVVAAAWASPGARAQDAPLRSLPAVVDRDLDVSGAWSLSQDLVVREGATLRFTAGATVAVAAKDGSASGDFRDRIEIVVRGRLVIDGTPAAPVVLGTADAPGPWQGIVLVAGRSRSPESAIRGLRIRGAYDGIAVGDGAPRIEASTFEQCTNGVACGTLWGDGERRVELPVRPAPDVVRCAFVRCANGVFTELEAAPEILRCVFLECARGLGNSRRWARTYPVTGAGARVDRALFVRTTVAVAGPSIVENSVFLANGTVLAVSDFHAKYSQQVDRFAWRRNVLWSNQVSCKGESDLGTDNAFADPGLPGLSEPGWTAGPPEGETAAPEGSPLRAYATDGGDCGPWGRGAVGRSSRPWVSSSRAVRQMLVLGPPARVDAKTLPTSAPSAAGERCGEAWWAAFDVAEDGLLDRAALRWPDDVPVVVAALWSGPGAPEAEVNADGRCAGWAAGRSLPLPPGVRRSGSRGTLVPLPGTAERGLVLWWSSADLGARLGVAVHGSAAVAAAGPADVPADVAAEPIRFGARTVGLRVRVPFHWADVRRPGVFRLRTASGDVTDLADLGLAVHDAKGTLRAELPSGTPKAGARIVVDGLRDPWGRHLGGQPLEIPAEPGP